ncbi:Granulin [Aphelenchoides bicaudatus]|nr:Granulin [Aphelenchoides bicaudatus]
MAFYSLLLLVFFANQAFGQIQCGDNSTYCPTGSTCCPLDANTHYGCCPIPDAVCCEDKLHCCPSGMQCDTAHAQCTNSRGVSLPMYKKHFGSSEERLPSETSPLEKSNSYKTGVPLQGSTLECKNGDLCSGESTCCHDSNNEAYCCPTSKAKCCRGAKKCCPYGFVCSTYGDECIREKHGLVVTTQMFDTKLAEEFQNKHGKHEWKPCPDGSLCPHKNTCCQTGNSYQCCSLTDGKCCDNFCCPMGYSCSANRQCRKSHAYDFFDSAYN